MAANAGDYLYPHSHPVTHDGYSDPSSTFGASNVEHKYTPTHHHGPHPFYDSFHSNLATAFSTISSRDLLDMNPSLLEPTLSRIAPASSCLSSATESSTYPTSINHNLPSAIATNPRFVSYVGEPYRKRPRGTTGTIVCNECGQKFTRPASLHRHCETSHGKKSTRKPRSARRKIIKTKDARFATGYNDPPLSANSPILEPSQDESQFGQLESNTLSLLTANTPIGSPGSEHATSVFDPVAVAPSNQQPHWTKYYVPGRLEKYVPRRLDNSADHSIFFCDLCPTTFGRRDTLQLHKARIHELKEIGYLQDMGAIDLPPYLLDITPSTGSRHSRTALTVFENGGLSSSPCQSCLLKGIDCIVNPSTSSKCCHCNHLSNGVYCGAAGVKLA